MDNAGQKIFPPLRIWIYLFISTLLIAAILFYLDRLQTQYDFDSRSRYVTQGFAAAKGKPVVLVIGTSLLECGLDSSQKIEACVEKLSGKSIGLLKIFRPAATLSEFADRMKTLDQLKPNIVVVEANMLFYRSYQDPILSRCLYVFRSLFTGSLHQTYFPDEHPYANIPQQTVNSIGNSLNDTSQISFVRVSEKTVDQLRNGLIDTSQLSSFRNLAADWQSKGTRFLLINFPIERSEEAKKWNRSDTSAFYFNMRYLHEKIKLEYFNTGLTLDSSFFFDQTHLNLKGSSIFSNSFCRILAIELKSL